jgi:phage tail sheath protein FI
VYVEERRRGLTAIQGVSTSNYGTVGFTPKGPTNVATLATSFGQAERTFGSFTEKGQVMTQTFAFFANNGVRAYIVRVVASDAVKALSPATTASNPRIGSGIGNPITEETIDTGDGVTKAIAGTLAELPCRPGSVSITYKEAGTPVAGEDTNATPAPAGAPVDFIGRITGSLPIVPGTVTLTTTVAAAPVTYTDPAKDGLLKDAGTDVRGYIDYVTGHYSLSVGTAAPDALSTIDADYTPAGTEQTVIDDGDGALTGATLAAPGTIDYATGAVAFTIAGGSAAPHDLNPILAAYIQNAFDADPISEGEWGNGLQLQTRGNEDYLTRATHAYTKHDVLVVLDGTIEEIFSALQFTDPTAADYAITIINETTTGSKLVDLVDPSNDDNKPSNLDGKLRTRAVAAGNGTATEFGSTGTADPDGFPDIPVGLRSMDLETPVQPTSIEITYTDLNGVARTITDDGAGNLIGDIDPAAGVGYNQVDYDSGKFAFKTVAAISIAETSHATPPTALVPGSLAGAQHYVEPSATTNTDDFTGGSDGVAAIGRNQLTDPTLKTDREGMYALLVPDELLNIAIPDAAGDVTMAIDQITEAETNGKWFIILASPPGMSPQQVKDWRRNTLGSSSSYAALYYPYITIADPVTDNALNIPPQGHIAGVYARTDATRSVGKAPAGTIDGVLNWSIGLERKLEFSEIDAFFQSQVNALMDTPQTGRVVWGARTLENPPDDFQFVHVRRLFNFLKASIYNSTHGFVFENVGAALRGRIQLSVESFLLGLFNQGIFAGDKPSDGFQVVCDETNNPPEVEQAGEVICDVFVAPNRPGEFIVFRIQQMFTAAAA